MTRTIHRHTWWDQIREHMSAAPAASPVLTAGEQTRLSWARRIETPEAAPPIYAERLAAITARAGCFPYCVLTPAYAGFLTRTTEKLVCTYADEIAVVERAGGDLRSTVYSLDNIDLMEVGCVLLSSWLKIVGTDDRDRRTSPTTCWPRCWKAGAARREHAARPHWRRSRRSSTIFAASTTSS